MNDQRYVERCFESKIEQIVKVDYVRMDPRNFYFNIVFHPEVYEGIQYINFVLIDEVKKGEFLKALKFCDNEAPDIKAENANLSTDGYSYYIRIHGSDLKQKIQILYED